ncbi:MAG: S8 family serine peptidase [Pirellulaceae bacterium]
MFGPDTSVSSSWRRALFDEYEQRLVLSAQPLGDFFIDDALLQEVQPQQIEALGALADVHQATGVSYVRQEYGLTGAGQTVVVIDSGIAYDHVALGGGLGSGYRVVGGWDFTEENDADPYDDGPAGFHGTHVAGIIGSNSSQHPGVAPEVDLVGLRVFNDQGAGYFDWVENALNWVHQHRNDFANPITTVNLSLGTDWNSDTLPSWATLEDELRQLYQDGIVVTVSAGNSFTDYNAAGLSYPAASQYVMPIASVDDAGMMSYFSQRNARVIAAPGERITSTVPDHIYGSDGNPDDWASASGTSMAAPYVAGASVLVREAMQITGVSNITQDTIYNHLRNTADSFYDSVTNANYYRLNVQRAVDALLGTDDVGSTPESAKALGDVFGVKDIHGTIGRLTDADYFRFTASASGNVQLGWNATGALNPVVTLDGVVLQATGGNSAAFQVVAGRTYTLGITTADGLGGYAFQLQSTPSTPAATPPQDLGVVDLRTIAIEQTSGEQWFAVKATRSGWFTAQTVTTNNAAGSAGQIQLRSASGGALSGVVTTANGTRADVMVQAGDSLLVKVTGVTAASQLKVANLVSFSGDTATVFGTAGDDTFEVQIGGSQRVTVAGLSYSFNASQYRTVALDGAGGVDTATVQGTLGKETVIASPGSFAIQASTGKIVSQGIELVTIHGGGGADQATMYDDSSNDLLQADGPDVRLSGPRFANRVVGFAQVQVFAEAGGRDRVVLHDSVGNDRVDIGLGTVAMSANGYAMEAFGFDQVHAYASRGGYDRVVFHDSSADDTFTATPEYASLSGGGHYSYAEKFDVVIAEAAAGGNDRAYLYDSTGDDEFRATTSGVTMTGLGIQFEARGFSQVIANATAGGSDRAYLYDSAGNDSATSRADDLTLVGTGYSHRAKGFEQAYAYAVNGGQDTVSIYDASTVSPQSVANSLTVRGANYTHYVHGFDAWRQLSSDNVAANSMSTKSLAQSTAQRSEATGLAAEQMFADTTSRLTMVERANVPEQQLSGVANVPESQRVESMLRALREAQSENVQLDACSRIVGASWDDAEDAASFEPASDIVRRLLDELAHLDNWFDELAADV